MSEFINAMLEELDVAFLDDQNTRVMCKICKKHINLEKPPSPDSPAHHYRPTPEELHRRWRLDWRLHRQSHFGNREQPRGGTRPQFGGNTSNTSTPPSYKTHSVRPKTLEVQNREQQQSRWLSAEADERRVRSLERARKRVKLERRAVRKAQERGEDVSGYPYGWWRYRDKRVESGIVFKPGKEFCWVCTHWIVVDPQENVHDPKGHDDDLCEARHREFVNQARQGMMSLPCKSLESPPRAPLFQTPPPSGHAPTAQFPRRNPMSISSLLSPESSTSSRHAPVPAPTPPREKPHSHSKDEGIPRPHRSGTVLLPPIFESSPESAARDLDRSRRNTSDHTRLMSDRIPSDDRYWYKSPRLPPAMSPHSLPMPPRSFAGSSPSSGDSPILPVTPQLIHLNGEDATHHMEHKDYLTPKRTTEASQPRYHILDQDSMQTETQARRSKMMDTSAALQRATMTKGEYHLRPAMFDEVRQTHSTELQTEYWKPTSLVGWRHVPWDQLPRYEKQSCMRVSS